MGSTYHGNALVIAPHADDETFGCGGTIAKMKDAGIYTNVVVMCKPEASRKIEFRNACEVLGVDTFDGLNHNMDGIMDKYPIKIFVSQIESCLDFKEGYDYVFIPYPSHHQDHKITYQACIAALRPGGIDRQPHAVLAYEYSYPEWDEFDSKGYLYVSIDAYWDEKKAAMEAYKTQLKDHPHPVSVEAYYKLAGLRGLAIGGFAERFNIIKMREIPLFFSQGWFT